MFYSYHSTEITGFYIYLRVICYTLCFIVKLVQFSHSVTRLLDFFLIFNGNLMRSWAALLISGFLYPKLRFSCVPLQKLSGMPPALTLHFHVHPSHFVCCKGVSDRVSWCPFLSGSIQYLKNFTHQQGSPTESVRYKSISSLTEP